MIPEGWEESTVGKSYKICNNLRFPINLESRKEMKGVYPYYGPTGVLDFIDEYRLDGEYALIGEDGDHFLKYNDKPMTLLINGKVNVNNHAHIIQGNLNCRTDWFYYYFMNRPLTPYLTRQGAGRYKLNKSALENVSILIPPLPEQRKIAEILGAWDESIALLEKLITAKRKLKQGLMQQLLTGKKRFKEFENKSSFSKSSDCFQSNLCDIPNDWLKIPIGKVCRSIVPGRNKPKSFNGDIPWITTPNITHKYISINNANLFVTEEEIKKCGSKIVPKESIIINCVGDFGIIGIAKHNLVINQQLHGFVCPREMSNEYIYYALSIQINYMFKVATTTTISYMNKSSCESIPILIPPLPEQEKIASVLSAADTEISTLEKQLAAYKQQKRGLMQQLLTGKTRVNVN